MAPVANEAPESDLVRQVEKTLADWDQEDSGMLFRERALHLIRLIRQEAAV